MGELMRRYCHPIAGSSEIGGENPTKECEGAILPEWVEAK
jgi:hypothetical protein